MGGIHASAIVLCAALGLAAPAWSATTADRDHHAQAIAALIAAGMRLPAERQFSEFQAARYPTDASLDVVLRFLLLDHFLARLPDHEQQARAAELKHLRTEVARLQSSMSTGARAVLARGTGTSSQLVNAIARVAHPDDAPPLVPLAAEKSAHLRAQVERLITVMEDEFHQALVVVQAHESTDQEALDLPPGSPQQRAALQAVIDRHLAALRPLRTGMLVLREVVARGNDYGIDPTAVRERVRALFAAKPPKVTAASVAVLIADWEFAWGEISPVIGEWCGSLLGDTLALGLSAVRPDEVDAIQRRILALDPRQQQETRFQLDVLAMQVRTTTDAMRWRLQRGDRAGYAEAWQLWQEYGQRAQQEQRLVPGRNPQLATDLARLHLIAARTAVAMGNAAEGGMVLQRFLATGPTPPFAAIVKQWRAYFATCGVVPVAVVVLQAMDPAQAITLARAHLDEAKATSDAQAARQQHLQAAAVLRSGIRGLQAMRGDERAAVDNLAQLYHLYVITLSRLEMRHHAAIAALAGTDQALSLIDRLGQQKKPNPWKRTTADGRIAWDDSRVTPLRVATDGVAIASQLKARDPGMSGLYLAAMTRLGRLDPSNWGDDLIKPQIAAMIEEDDYDGALREAEQLLYAKPDQDAWVSGVRNRVMPLWAQRLRRNGEAAKADGILDRLARDNAAMLTKAQTELAKPDLVPARRQELERVLAQIRLADIDTLLVRQDYVPALARIAELLDATSPADAAQTTRLQERLAQATTQWLDAQRPTITTSLPTLQDWATRLDQVRRTLQASSTRTGTPLPVTVQQRMALAYHHLRSVLPAQVPTGADAALINLVRALDRGFAESFAPTIDAQTPAGNLMALGNTWWALGERAQAIAPYEQGLTKLLEQQPVVAFLQDRRAWLAPRTEIVATRAEFRARWEQVVALCGGDGERRAADLHAASAMVSTVKADIDAAKAVLGAELHLRLLTAVGEVDAVLRRLLGAALARQRLADCYRATGRPEAAIPHLQQLCAQEPNVPAHRLALVLAIQASQQPSSRADLEQARRLAAQIRDERQGTIDKVGYWEASLLVLEFSLLLGEQRMVDDTLAFMGRNRSDLSRDLIAPPVVGDDRRLRRPAGPEAVALARRFLDLYGKPGITVRPPFRIESVAGGVDLFVDGGAPVPVARTITTPDDQQFLVYVMDGEPQPIP